MITLDARPDEPLAEYLARCLETAQHTSQTVCATHGGTVGIVVPAMTIQELGDAWLEASQRRRRTRRA
jgi:hypothetical protein